MICQPCTRGDHCGPPGVASPHCACQHRPRKDNGCPYCRGSQNPDMRDHVRNVHPDQFLAWDNPGLYDDQGNPIPTVPAVTPPLTFTSGEVEIMADAVDRLSAQSAEERRLIDRCEDTNACCPGDTCRLDAWRAARVGVTASGGAGASQVHPEASGPSDDDSRPFVVVLTEWFRLHRAGHYVQAANLRKVLITKLDRLGRDPV